MDIFELLIDDLGGVTGPLRTQLLAELRSAVAASLANEAAKVSARALLKGVDGVTAAAVKHLSTAQATALVKSFVDDAIGEQYDQLQEALRAYAPLQLAVELAKKEHGNLSDEAAEARVARRAGIDELREEVRDVLRVATGQAPVD